jgi:hypothetical protein
MSLEMNNCSDWSRNGDGVNRLYLEINVAGLTTKMSTIGGVIRLRVAAYVLMAAYGYFKNFGSTSGPVSLKENSAAQALCDLIAVESSVVIGDNEIFLLYILIAHGNTCDPPLAISDHLAPYEL